MCKFYQGAEDKALELRLKALFTKVHREKPESSRSVSSTAFLSSLFLLSRCVLAQAGAMWEGGRVYSEITTDRNPEFAQESKEAYFVALRRKSDTPRKSVFGDDA